MQETLPKKYREFQKRYQQEIYLKITDKIGSQNRITLRGQLKPILFRILFLNIVEKKFILYFNILQNILLVIITNFDKKLNV